MTDHHHHDDRKEILARQPRFPFRNGETGTIDQLRFHLDSSEDRASAYPLCDHTTHKQSCPRCRYDLAVNDYIFAAETEIYWQRGYRGHPPLHDPETLTQLRTDAAEASVEYDRIFANKEKHRHRTLIDAATEADFAETLLFRARMAAQAAERRARRTGNIKRRAITDGYIRTGKTMMIDGERVPVVRKVEFLR